MLGGQPDLVTRNGETGSIIAVKTRRDSLHHIIQVMLYMYALPKAIRKHRDVVLNGHVPHQITLWTSLTLPPMNS